MLKLSCTGNCPPLYIGFVAYIITDWLLPVHFLFGFTCFTPKKIIEPFLFKAIVATIKAIIELSGYHKQSTERDATEFSKFIGKTHFVINFLDDL